MTNRFDDRGAPRLGFPTLPTSEVLGGQIQDTAVDAIVVGLLAGVTSPGGAAGAVDAAMGGAISRLIAAGDLTGKLGEVTVLYPASGVVAPRVLVVGLGSKDAFGLEAVRRASGTAAARARELGATTLASAVHGVGVGGLATSEAAQATLEGALLASYRFGGWRAQGSGQERALSKVALVELDGNRLPQVREGATAAAAIARGVALARDLVNLPPVYATPVYLADAAAAMAERTGLRVTIGDRAWAEERAMGAFLAVTKGSALEPRFIELGHNEHRTDLPLVVLVGKGVTFDSGGLSLKTRDGMVPMKSDMSGAAAVIGAMQVVAELGLNARVIGLAPCVENMPDGAAYRPSDVLVAGNGLSIEVISTDAEGRLALADALVHAKGYAPAAVIDIATLTGASVTALGEGVAASLFFNDPTLRARLETAAEATGERVWPMPLFPEYRAAIESKVADLKNSGGAKGGVGTAAAFLQAFTDYPWAHVDMAGLGLVENPKGRAYLTPGATGYGVRLFVEFLRDWA